MSRWTKLGLLHTLEVKSISEKKDVCGVGRINAKENKNKHQTTEINPPTMNEYSVIGAISN
jgi:hypothetical protein